MGTKGSNHDLIQCPAPSVQLYMDESKTIEKTTNKRNVKFNQYEIIEIIFK